MRQVVALFVVAVVFFSSGFAAGKLKKHPPLSFHDVIVSNPFELSRLITPKDRRIKALATELKTPENAYKYVQEHIVNDAADPAIPAGDILESGKASCLGKAILLCTLYRAMGVPASDVRVVAGEVDIPGSIIDHAWLEMEYNGSCIQQDTSNVLGSFSFRQFTGTNYTQVFIRDEEFVFNDKQFAIVSQLNKLKGMGHPPIQ